MGDRDDIQLETPVDETQLTTVAARPWRSLRNRNAVIRFGPTAGAPRVVRHFVDETVRSWGFGNLAPAAELLVSEIVTNVVIHAGTDGRVTLSALPTGVRVEVEDEGELLPTERAPHEREPDGRGLGIVSALARRWGVTLQPRSKVVWFELDDDVGLTEPT